jgi:hypothetical protein
VHLLVRTPTRKVEDMVDGVVLNAGRRKSREEGVKEVNSTCGRKSRIKWSSGGSGWVRKVGEEGSVN